jgi:hypothetical protein
MRRQSIPRVFTLTFLLLAGAYTGHSQQTVHYNLQQMLQDNKLVAFPDSPPQALNDSLQKEAISARGVVWLKGVDFKEGTIEVDLRGKDVFLNSFLGIAFHGVNDSTYDAVYFRPFNFRHADTARRKWSVQYFSLPEYDYDRLRKEHPLVYENAVTPVPLAADWFHATIIVKQGWVTVYVNHSATASLTVRLLNERASGPIGLWDSGLYGDFANLEIGR